MINEYAGKRFWWTRKYVCHFSRWLVRREGSKNIDVARKQKRGSELYKGTKEVTRTGE